MSDRPLSMTKRALRIGLVGASRIAPRAVILPAVERSDVQIACVAARDRDRAAAYAAEHGIAQVADTYAALLARDELDLVYISLPPSEHRRWAEAALAARKAVLCEKPFALNVDEARAMVAAADGAGLPLLEAFHYRFHAVFRHVERIVAAARLGTMRRASASFCLPLADRPDDFRWQAALGGGALADLGCYAVHALRTLTGCEPEVISARMVDQAGVDAVTEAACRFGDIDATILCSMIAATAQASLQVVGDRATLTLENYVAPQLGHRLTIVEGERIVWRGEIAGPTSYAEQLAHVVDVVLHGARAEIGGTDAIATMAALDAIREASKRGGSA